MVMRPFNPDHSWGKKEVKDWDFLRDKNGNIVIDESSNAGPRLAQISLKWLVEDRTMFMEGLLCRRC